MINRYTIQLDFNSYPRFKHSVGYSNCKLRKRITNPREKIAQLDIMIKIYIFQKLPFFVENPHIISGPKLSSAMITTLHNRFILSHRQVDIDILLQHVQQFKFAPLSRCAVISFQFYTTQNWAIMRKNQYCVLLMACWM